MITTADIIVMFLEENGVSVKKVTRFGIDRYRITAKGSNVSVYTFPSGTVQGIGLWTNLHNPDSLGLILRYVTTPPTAKDCRA